MSVYFLTGKLGNGKTLASVGRIQKYLKEGRRVATNLDIYPEHLVGIRNKNIELLRLPDKPRLQDLEMLGTGDGKSIEEYSEKGFGLIVLDELGTWFNSRSWNSDKSRQDLINWMLHARKLHWDLILIVQDVEAVDKQLRDMLCENLVICRRLDNIRIPIIGPLFKFLTAGYWTPKLPRIHRAKVHAGQTKSDWVADVWTYQGDDLFKGYRTGQCFTYDEIIVDGETVDMRSSYTILPPWYTHGRYRQKLTFKQIGERAMMFFFRTLGALILTLSGRPLRSGGRLDSNEQLSRPSNREVLRTFPILQDS